MLFYVLKLNIKTFTFGWAMFSYGLLVDFLDEFTKESEFFNTYLEGILISIGLFIVISGFFKSVTKEKQEALNSLSKGNLPKLFKEIDKSRLTNIVAIMNGKYKDEYSLIRTYYQIGRIFEKEKIIRIRAENR